jgi:nucleoside diphosphate kinase
MQSDVVTGMELVKEDAVAGFRAVLGPTNSQEAKATDPNSLRAYFGSDAMRNAIHGSATGADFNKESELLRYQASCCSRGCCWTSY